MEGIKRSRTRSFSQSSSVSMCQIHPMFIPQSSLNWTTVLIIKALFTTIYILTSVCNPLDV